MKHSMPKKQPTQKTELARVVTELRGRKGWSQNELSRRAGLSPAAVSRFLTGERRLRLEHLFALAEALEVSPEQLVAGTEAKELLLRWTGQTKRLRKSPADEPAASEVEALRREMKEQAAHHARRLADLQRGRDRALRLANKYHAAWETLLFEIARTYEEAIRNNHRTIDVETLATLHDNAKG